MFMSCLWTMSHSEAGSGTSCCTSCADWSSDGRGQRAAARSEPAPGWPAPLPLLPAQGFMPPSRQLARSERAPGWPTPVQAGLRPCPCFRRLAPGRRGARAGGSTARTVKREHRAQQGKLRGVPPPAAPPGQQPSALVQAPQRKAEKTRGKEGAAPPLACRSGPRSVHIWPSAWQALHRTRGCGSCAPCGTI